MEKNISRRTAIKKMGTAVAGAMALGIVSSESEENALRAMPVPAAPQNRDSSRNSPVTIFTNNSDQITRAYYDSLLVESRYLNSVLPDTSLTLFGQKFDTPVMTAALSHLDGNVPDGMCVYARGAQMSNAVHWMGMGEDSELERVTATGARTIKVIKPHADNNEIFRRIEHAVKHGCLAVAMDIDHSFSSRGQYDNVEGHPMKAKTTEEIASFVKASKIPFIVKGVMSPYDAECCMKAGVGGIMVSHHHGMMDYSCPPPMVLPEILKVVGKKIPVFVDCGIQSGMDVYKSLALGATAVSVGRHLMSLLQQGSEAISRRIDGMTAELAGVMARTGVPDLSKMDPSVLHRRTF